MIVSTDPKKSDLPTVPIPMLLVTLNGRKVECVYADTEKGYIERYSRTFNGQYHVIYNKNGPGFIVERRYGNVEIYINVKALKIGTDK